MRGEGSFIKGLTAMFALGVVALILLGVGSVFYKAYGTGETVSIQVTDKERIQDGDASRYLIYSEGEVFENTDTLLLGKFDSSDLQAQVEPGRTYTCDVNGWRLQFFSAYRNVLECEGLR